MTARSDALRLVAKWCDTYETDHPSGLGRELKEIAMFLRGEATRRERAALCEPAANPAAVALSELGASKGGLARAAKLSAARRLAIAKKGGEATRKRWKAKRDERD